ncbi:MAG: DUF4080 domain-containing protein [Clostridium sp.]
MKFLLAAINAKYIHSNLGIYSLKTYADKKLMEEHPGDTLPIECPQIEMGEYTINHRMEYILQDIYRRNPDVTGFSCYIWNIVYVKELVRDIKKVRPGMSIWLGGPEASYHAVEILREMPEVDGVMVGEGEESFYRLVRAFEMARGQQADGFLKLLSEISGLTYRKSDGSIVENPISFLMNLDDIPFSYSDLTELEHRIIYYESSRGCPFSCSYCLSSIDKAVRFRSVELVKQELSFFLERKVPQVKFVDRTFNCKKSHALEIWNYVLEHDNGVTNFHFEISADLLDEEELALMERMRPGLIQLEIGVQTTNPDTIKEIRRSMDLDRVRWAVEKVNHFHNIHQHLDLIAGLPYENYESFKQSFNDVYAMRPEQLQLGFLKVLKGSYMAEMAANYELIHHTQPPYEVLSTRWLSYEDIICLKGVEEMLEIHYNSGQFRHVMEELEKEFTTPFELYETLAAYYEVQGLEKVSHSRLARYEILYRFIGTLPSADRERYRDLLMYDLYLRENLKSRPSFARDQSPYKEQVRPFKQNGTMTHIEVMGDGTMILFDYQNRDALLGNAAAIELVR